MPINNYEIYVGQWVSEVYNRCDEVDPEDEHDWSSLSYGWALGKGLTPADAADLAYHIRRNTPYG